MVFNPEEVQLDAGLEVNITVFFVSVKCSPLCILIWCW